MILSRIELCTVCKTPNLFGGTLSFMEENLEECKLKRVRAEQRILSLERQLSDCNRKYNKKIEFLEKSNLLFLRENADIKDRLNEMITTQMIMGAEGKELYRLKKLFSNWSGVQNSERED